MFASFRESNLRMSEDRQVPYRVVIPCRSPKDPELEIPCRPKFGIVNPNPLLLLLFVTFAAFGMVQCAAASTVLYQTSFEFAEGYSTNLDLVGQRGWVVAGSGGNGLVSGYFSGGGQQAYIGFSPPGPTDASLIAYQPINKTVPQAQFSVTMAIIDSSATNTNRDDFYWSVYNKQAHSLFTLDFDNYELKLYYYLDNTNGRTWSGISFTNGAEYHLNMALNFDSNRWSATFDGRAVATNQPITTTGAPLNLGDIDAGWAIFDPAAPGDNYMVFDDYQITTSAPPPQVGLLGLLNGSPKIRVTGLGGNSYVLQTSTNLVNWLPLTTNALSAGSFDFSDATASGSRQFYRVRWIP
jgi:hypothetical protein